MIDGVLYVPSAFSRLFALDAETGTKLWVFDPAIDKSVPRNLYVNRGVSSWTDGRRRLVFLGDVEGRLFAIDAATGRPDPGFGEGGRVDLRSGMAEGFPAAQYGLTSPAAVCGDVVVTGSLVSDGAPQGPSGDVRGFDARSGKPLWRFHTVPRPGESGHETWEGESWKDRGGANAWSFLSVDEARGLVFLPLTSPAYDFYGGDRKGANLFGNSVVALDCATGQAPLALPDRAPRPVGLRPARRAGPRHASRREGREVPAVAQVTKTGFVFVLHRETGEPLFPVEERPVPEEPDPRRGGEPDAARPREAATVRATVDEPRRSHRRHARVAAGVRGDRRKGALLDTGLFQPLGEQDQALFPGLNGGANYGGASFDPGSRLLFVNSMDVGGLFRLAQALARRRRCPTRCAPASTSSSPTRRGTPARSRRGDTLTAIDLDSGEFRWQVRLGEIEELTRLGVPKTGAPNIGGSIVTDGGLVFVAATSDRRIRAFDRDTGRELWSAALPASGFATPMTFLGRKTGRQFVVIAAGGGNKYDKAFGGQLVAFALPAGKPKP